jgi:hypothetical protein
MPRVGRVDSVANLLIESPVCEGLGAEFLPVDQSSSHRVRCDLELAQVRSSGIVDASDAIDAERPEYASKTGSAVMTVVVNPSGRSESSPRSLSGPEVCENDVVGAFESMTPLA